MADNVAITPGSGATVRTDDVAGVQYQVVKLDLGGDGASIPVVTTLPVSGTVTANIGSSGSLALDATLTGGTQKSKLVDTGGTNVAAVSAAGRLSVDASGVAVPITDNAGSLTVDAPVGTPVFVEISDGAAIWKGQKAMASSLPVVVASDQTVIPVSDNAGSLTVDAPVGTPVFARLSDGAAALIGSKVSASSIPVVIASDQAAVAVTPPTLTKSTQGATGFSTQDLKDAGRAAIAITSYQAAGIITTEALFAAATFSKSVDGAAASTGIQFTVTAGKRFRVQSIMVTVKNTAAAAGTAKLALRYLGAGGTILNTSPILAILDIGSNNATANNYIGPYFMDIPDGFEMIASSTFGFTSLCSAVTMLHTITMLGYEY